MTDDRSGEAPILEHRIGTPLGDVIVTARGHTSVRFEEMPASVPALPQGMRVAGVKLLRVQFQQSITLNQPHLLQVATARPGDASTGEWLESMEFENPDGVLQVGLRDCEWLAGEGISASWASYDVAGLRQTITAAPADASIFVSVAWRSASNTDADEDVSTWFAVDLMLPNAKGT